MARLDTTLCSSVQASPLPGSISQLYLTIPHRKRVYELPFHDLSP